MHRTNNDKHSRFVVKGFRTSGTFTASGLLFLLDPHGASEFDATVCVAR